MTTFNVARPPEHLFTPSAARLQTGKLNPVITARRMRDNPMAVLPDDLLHETRLTASQFGRSVHKVSGPGEMKSIMQDNFQAWRKSPLILRMLRPILGDAILTSHGDNWRRQRMTLQPAFLKRRLDRFAPTMVQAALRAVDRLGSADGPIDVHAVMNDTTFAVIERTLFSDVEGFDRTQVRAAIEVLLKEIGEVRYSDLIPFPEWVPRQMRPAAVKAREVFRAAADSQIRRRRALSDPGTDLLGLLLQVRDEVTGEGLSDIDIRDTLMTFVAAGHETTALALTWALYLIANDDDCLAALRAEADAVFAAGTPDGETAPQLVLHKQVIEEALRLYPPAPILGRRAVQDTEICGHPVRKGDMALLAFYALHRHHTFWDHPECFDPDRWSPQRRPSDRYMTMAFGGGPRACIGSQFALMEAAIILSVIVSRLDISPAHGAVEPVMQVTLRPRGGMPLKFKAR